MFPLMNRELLLRQAERLQARMDVLVPKLLYMDYDGVSKV